MAFGLFHPALAGAVAQKIANRFQDAYQGAQPTREEQLDFIRNCVQNDCEISQSCKSQEYRPEIGRF
jgi:hypothetical protein